MHMDRRIGVKNPVYKKAWARRDLVDGPMRPAFQWPPHPQGDGSYMWTFQPAAEDHMHVQYEGCPQGPGRNKTSLALEWEPQKESQMSSSQP